MSKSDHELVEEAEAAAVMDRLARCTVYEAHQLQAGGMAASKAAQVAVEGALGAAVVTYRAACLAFDEAADESRLAGLLARLQRRPVTIHDATTGASLKPH